MGALTLETAKTLNFALRVAGKLLTIAMVEPACLIKYSQRILGDQHCTQ